MPSRPEKPLPYCSLCSMCCPVGAEVDRLGHVSSVFPVDLGVEQGACVLGLTAAALLRAENRLYRASCDGQARDLQEAVEDLAGRLSSFDDSEVALLWDVSRPLEGLAAAAALRSAALPGSRFAPFVPPEDEPFLRAGLGRCPPAGGLADHDVVVTVGDVFSTHRVIASPVRDVQLGKRGNKFLAVDTAPGRTARSADERILIDPQKLAGFLCAAAIECGCEELSGALDGPGVDEICGKLALPAERVRSLAGALKDADSPAVVISNTRGRYAHAGAVIRAAAELARAVNAALFPLLLAPNSLAAALLKERFSAGSVGSLLEAIEAGQVRALLVVGVDPASAFPERIWKGFAEQVDFLAWAGSLESEFAQMAQIVVPLALPWEEGGSILLPGGQVTEARPWSDIPSRVVSAEQLARSIGEKLGAGAIEPERLDALERAELAALPLDEEVTAAILEAPGLGEGEAVLVGAPEPYAYDGGLSTAAGSWQSRMAAQERAVVSGSLATETGAADGDLVTLSGDHQATLPCVVQNEIEAKVATLPSHRADLRHMLEWRVGRERVEVNPAAVKVTKVQ